MARWSFKPERPRQPGAGIVETDAGGMAGIWRKLHERYPLLGELVVDEIGQEYSEAFPPFFGLFLAALDAKKGPPCCFVLPRRGQMARLAAIVFGLSSVVSLMHSRGNTRARSLRKDKESECFQGSKFLSLAAFGLLSRTSSGYARSTGRAVEPLLQTMSSGWNQPPWSDPEDDSIQ